MIEIISGAADSISGTFDLPHRTKVAIEAPDYSAFIPTAQEQRVTSLSFAVKDYVAVYGEMDRYRDPDQMIRRVDLGGKGVVILATASNVRRTRSSVIGLESEKETRYLVIPAGGKPQIYKGIFEVDPLIFPGQKASLDEIKYFENLLKIAKRKSGKPLRRDYDHMLLNSQRSRIREIPNTMAREHAAWEIYKRAEQLVGESPDIKSKDLKGKLGRVNSLMHGFLKAQIDSHLEMYARAKAERDLYDPDREAFFLKVGDLLTEAYLSGDGEKSRSDSAADMQLQAN